MGSAVLQKEIIAGSAARKVLGCVFFALCMFLSACIRIPLPFSPVPVTLQTFFVLLSGACLGSIGGISSQALYLCLGAAGFPVFSNAGSGSLYFAGPTAGYLAGFVLAAWFTGFFIGRARSLAQVCAVFACADILILLCGTFWLKLFCVVPVSQLSLAGFFAFVPADAVKACAAAAVYWNLKGRCRQIFKA